MTAGCYSPRSSHAARASAAGTAPSRRTRGSGPVRSSTVDGVPGSSPPSSDGRDAARGSRRERRRARRGSGAAVQVRARRGDDADARRAARRPTPRKLGNADADRVGPRPVSQRKRARGIREDERVRARAGATARRVVASSGTRSRSASTLAATSAIGCSAERPLSAESARTGSSRSGRHAEPVDGVGRDDDELARAIAATARSTALIAELTSLDDPVAPARSGVDRDVVVAEAREQRRDAAPRRRPRPRGRARRPAASTSSAPRATASVAPCADERLARLPVAHLGLERVDLLRAGRTADSRRRGPTARPEAR